MSADSKRPPLDYAPPRRLWRYRWAVVWLLLTAAAVGAAARFHGPPIHRPMKYLAWQRRCMNYTAPASQVVYYEKDWVHGLRTSPKAGYDRVYFGPQTMPMANIPMGYMPPVWAENSSAWICAGGSWFGPGADPDPSESLAFLHSRRTPGGRERLVAVKTIAVLEWQSGCDIYLMGAAYRPATIRPGSTLQMLGPGERAVFASMPSPSRPPPGLLRLIPHDRQGLAAATVYAGQPDPADATHFTIAYSIGPAGGTIDGRLGDDDAVSLAVRDGPAAKPTSQP
jgi:hypothetical protein